MRSEVKYCTIQQGGEWVRDIIDFIHEQGLHAHTAQTQHDAWVVHAVPVLITRGLVYVTRVCPTSFRQ